MTAICTKGNFARGLLNTIVETNFLGDLQLIEAVNKACDYKTNLLARGEALFEFRLWTLMIGATALCAMHLPAKAQSSAMQTVGSMSCQSMTYGSLANAISFSPSRSEYLGISLKDWSPEVSNAVLDRIRQCSPEIGPRNVNDALRLLPQRLQIIVDAAAGTRSRTRPSAEMDFECAPSKVRDLTASDQAFLDAAMGPGVRRTARPSTPTILEPGSRDPAEQAAREARWRREAKQQACDDAAQAAADEKARTTLAQQRQEQIASAEASISARLAQAPPEIKSFVSRTPAMTTSASGSNFKQNLIGLYSAGIVLRVCRERYGDFVEQVSRLQEIVRLTEATYQQLHQVPASDIAAIRSLLGVDSGDGQLVDYARSSRDLLRSCNEFVSLYRLSAPLAR